MMEYKGYKAKVSYLDEEKIFEGEVLGLKDPVTFQGRTVKQIETSFREAVDDYLNFCEIQGEDPDKPYSGKFMVRIPEALHRVVAELAELRGESLNTFVTMALKEYTEKRGLI